MRLLFDAALLFTLMMPIDSVQAASADEPIPSFYEEAGKSANREYTDQHPREHIDPFTGKLQWHYVDLFIPGNGGFDLKVQRSYASQGEDFPAYSASGVGWTMHFGRVLRTANLALCDTTSSGTNAKKNPVLELPDGTRQVLYTAPDNVSFISTRFWKGVCTAGSLAVFSPEGTRYDMSFQGADEGSGPFPIHTYYVSRITDRNGNTMTLSYANLGVTTGVTAISTSDGRSLTFSYSGGTLSSVSDGSRTWTYSYRASSAMLGQVYLTRVQPPDGSPWQYDYFDTAMGTPGAASMKTVTYPTGGTIAYTYDFVQFSVSPSLLPRTTVVKTKITSDSGTWSFSYKPATQPIPEGTTNFTSLDPIYLDQTTVNGPDGRKIYSHLGYTSATSGWVWAIGLLVQVQTGGVQAEGFSWAPSVISNQTNLRPGGTLTFDAVTAAPMMFAKGVNRNGQISTIVYNGLDDFGNPGTVTEVGTEQKETITTYIVDQGKWILHTKKDETIRNVTTGENVGSILRTFDANANMLTESRFGVTTTFTYTAQGDIATKMDARNNATTFSSYFRGLPQTEAQPENVTMTRTVSGAGNITAQTDGENATTRFVYDGINRLTAITHPLGSPVSVQWTFNTRKVTRGAYVELLTFDGFGRTVREEHQGAAATVFQTTQYDPAGRVLFKSYPSSSTGTTFTVDELGRVKTTQHPSSTGGTVGRIYAYINNKTQVQNEKGQLYTYTYRVFGDPDQRDLVTLETPEASANVAITRNTLGQPTHVVQAGKSRDYLYDGHFFLASRTDPETGVTAFGRDAVGNMTTRSVGASGSTTFAYDGRNRLTSTAYPTPLTVSRTYYRDDKPKTLGTGVALESFVYDTNKNLTQETLAIDAQSFVTGYAYDGNDALNVVTYGSGKTVTYAPDALGRPTRAAPYLTSVTHHPTGQVASMTYANGVTTSVTLNARMWPSGVSIGPGSTRIFDLAYGYDENGNPTSIANASDTSYNRAMGYDGVDRLTSASGSWGAGTFTYDGRGNLAQQRVGASTLNYVYDGSDRLASVGGSRAYAFSYDAYGNVTGNGAAAFTYDDASTLRCIKCGSPDETRYDYDGAGRRVKMTKSGVITYFVYGLDDKLLWEKTPMSTIKEYVYLGNKAVATRSQGISVP